MSYISNMQFEVNTDAVISGMINGEIQARMCCRAKNPNLEDYKKGLKKYRDAGIVDSAPSVVNFMRKYPNVFRNSKLISHNGKNIFEEMITLPSSTGGYDENLKSRMSIEHKLTQEEIDGMAEFIQDFHALQENKDVQQIISETRQYGRSIERLWRANEKNIIEYIQSILGYVPENVGNVRTYIMFPNYDTHRSCQTYGNTTSLFLGIRGSSKENKTLAHLAHQAVHQPMLPYRMSMSKQDKDKLHGFIKFLTDKEIYSTLSGESSLQITTPQENHELMGKIYPYYLGYRFRNASKQGLNPVEEIQKVIQKDQEYYQSLPEGSKARKNYSFYEFDKLDPVKIAEFFRYRRGITPYDFIKIDFDNRDNVTKSNMKTEIPITKEVRNLEELTI